jgi:hypothetical protein
MQQLVTQVRDWEDEPSNLTYPFVMSASGKEDLGGGVTVGITTQLQNGKLAFEQRGASISAGTVTTISASGNTLIDSGATFITDGVIEGAAIINFTDQSVGTVLSIDSETQITLLTALEDGTDNRWDSADVYKIWNIIQCEASGGNLTAVDTDGLTIDAIFPTFGTQIVRTSSSSATLTGLDALSDRVYVDTEAVSNGSGGAGDPFDNIGDAIDFAEANNIKIIVVYAEITLDRNLKNFQIIGISNPVINCAGQDLKNTYFERCTLKGTYINNIAAINCKIDSTTYLEGVFEECIFPIGTTTIAAGQIVDIIQSSSGVPGATTPTIDMNATGILSIRGYNGGIKLINYSGSSAHSIDISSGQIILDSTTITSGIFVIRGVGKLIDENGNTIESGTWNGGVTIINELIRSEVINNTETKAIEAANEAANATKAAKLAAALSA